MDDSNLVSIQGSMHPAVRTAIDKGRLASGAPMGDLVLVLSRSEAQQAALEQFNEAQYDPSSPSYHHWLTPAQFGAAYGVSETDLEAVSSWLQSHGFTIQEIAPSRTAIRFSGNVGQVETAFHTEMHAIESRGEAHIANVTEIQIPAALSTVVVGVKALHDFFPKPLHHAGPLLSRSSSGLWTPVSESAAGARPQFGVASGGSEYELLVPYDMATIYNYKSLWTASMPINGTGQTIAIAGTSNIVLSDVATFRSATGLPANVPRVVITNSNPGTTSLLDDRMENTLDVEWSGASAPGASIVLVTSSQTTASTDALYLSESYIINNNVAKIMSVSYGECELGMGTAGNQEYANLWQQAYTQGIAVFVSTGDSVAAVCDDGQESASTYYAAQYGLSVSGMASTPYNVAVGGTDYNWTSANFSSTNSAANLSNALGYVPEVPWNGTVANPIAVSLFNSEDGVNYTAEKWANLLLKDYKAGSVSASEYESLIPPVGGSGGVSACTASNGSTVSSCSGGYAKPAWQTGVTGISASDKRTLPDVSFFASSGFLGAAYLICDTLLPGSTSAGTAVSCNYSTNALSEAVGGTSVSSPLMAGIMALINQKAGGSQGNPNAVLYALAAKQSYSSCSAESVTASGFCYFNDIDTGNIAAPCYKGSPNCSVQTVSDTLGILSGYSATTGYDKATGLGSLNVANVAKAWPSSTPATAPVVSLSPSSLTFASTNAGVTSAAQTVTLKNTGTAALSLTGITIGGTNATSFADTTTCGSTLAVSASCTVSVTFKPTANGTQTASLNFTGNAANSPQSVTLSGIGVAPVVSLSTTSLTFAATNIGVAAAIQSVTLTNTGALALSLTGISISVNTTAGSTIASSFSETTTCGTTIAVNASCTVSVTFKPTASGTLAATLSFADNAANSPQTVSLSGTGAAPAVSLSPANLSFALTSVGASSAAQSVTLKNTGTAALTLTGITVGGTNASSFTASNTCASPLASNASCNISVTFKPTAGGALSATLSFADNAANSPQTVSLSGTGAVPLPAVTLSAASLSFPVTTATSATSVSYSPAQLITLTNTGNAALSITSVALGGGTPKAFSEMSNCPSSLAASASCTALVRFAPTATGSQSATLVFTDNASPTTQPVTLSGTGGTAPTLTLSSSTLAFGAVTSGSTSGAQAVTLANNSSTTALNLSSIAISGSGVASFVQANNCPATLAAGANCVILAQFAPTAKGAAAASLTITANNPTASASVALSGTGQ